MPRQQRQRRPSYRVGGNRPYRRTQHANVAALDSNGNILTGGWNSHEINAEEPSLRSRGQRSRHSTRTQHANTAAVDPTGNTLNGAWNSQEINAEEPSLRSRRQRARSRRSRSRSRRKIRSRSRRSRRSEEMQEGNSVSRRSQETQDDLETSSNHRLPHNLETPPIEIEQSKNLRIEQSRRQSKSAKGSNVSAKTLHRNPNFELDESDSSNCPLMQTQKDETPASTTTMGRNKNKAPSASTTSENLQAEKAAKESVNRKASSDGSTTETALKVKYRKDSQRAVKRTFSGEANEDVPSILEAVHEELPQTPRTRKSTKIEPKYEEFQPPHTSSKIELS